jgi:transposase
VKVDELGLRSERLGPLPIINHFIHRLDLESILDRFVPTTDGRVRLTYSRALGVFLRSVLVEREPIYRQQELVSTFAPEQFGLMPGLIGHVGDDAVGRALSRLFDADRASMLTEVVIAATDTFGVRLDELHNDSTSVRFCGQYRAAKGNSIRGKKAPFITYGYSKDHRPDLKQLLFIMTTTTDGAVPVQFRSEAGNQNDSRTHEQSWDALCTATGRTDFLYVADSKLCNHDALDYIDDHGGRLVCVIPRNRHEDGEFREWIQDHDPEWELVWDRRHPRRKGGPRDRWWVRRHHIPSLEGWPVIWVYSSLLRLRQHQRRRERIAKATEKLQDLDEKLRGPRPRKRNRKEIYEQIKNLLASNKVSRYLKVRVVTDKEHTFRQSSRGRPGPKTRYVRKTRKFYRLEWELDEDAITYDRKSDGMYPLLTNDRSLAPAEVLGAHKRQPEIEKRFEQTKTVFEIAPVFLKKEDRVEALFFIYFLALLVQSLIEREIRLAMKREKIDSLPLYPEERVCHRPTCEQVFRLFSITQRNALMLDGKVVRVFDPQLTPLQRQVLDLLGIPSGAYRAQP